MPVTMPRLFERLDPRRSLAAAIGWLVIALSASLVLTANQWLRGFVRQTLLEQHSQRLEGAAEHVGAELDSALILRLQAVSTVAAMLSGRAERGDPKRLTRDLDAVRRELPDLTWLAITDANGEIVTATDPAVVGSNLYQYAWHSQGLAVAWIEDGTMPGERFLMLTAPLANADGALDGVVAARLSWRWMQTLSAQILAAPGEWLLIDRHQVVSIGPAAWLGHGWRSLLGPVTPFEGAISGLGADAADLPSRIEVWHLDGGAPYLVAHADPAQHPTLAQLGWKIVVIQPVAAVTALAGDIERRISATLALLGAIAAGAGIWMARRLTRRVGVIARSADAVLAGSATRIEVPAGRDEAARLGVALERLLVALQRERDGLRALNAELEQRVAQRTEEIRRLAHEARDAAVVRERLRLARDLHDTLAHSMMAMLTEIRLLKRLASSRPAELPDELVRAEEAARAGLHEARLAIAQLRSSPVRDVGLGAALAELVKGFTQRTGIAAALDAGAADGGLAEDIGETLFRMVEEMLRNVERHAGARSVAVTLRIDSVHEGLTLTVADDGVGFEPHAVGAGHYGLVGLREQAATIGASLTIEPGAPRGTVLRIALAAARLG